MVNVRAAWHKHLWRNKVLHKDEPFLWDEDVYGPLDMEKVKGDSCLYGNACLCPHENHTSEECYDEEISVYQNDVEPFLLPAKIQLRDWYDNGKICGKWSQQDVIDFAHFIFKCHKDV